MTTYKGINLSGGVLTDVCDEVHDALCVKYGSQWPMVLVARRLCKREDATWLERVVKRVSSRRRCHPYTLNRILDVAERVGALPDHIAQRYPK